MAEPIIITPTPEQNLVVAFFAETFKRFVSPNPTFFNILAWIGVAAVAVGYLPLIAPSIAVGSSWPLILKTAGWAFSIVAQFPVKPAAQVSTVVPFTAKLDGTATSNVTLANL